VPVGQGALTGPRQAIIHSLDDELGAALVLLGGILRAVDVRSALGRLIAAAWRSRCETAASVQDAEYWSLRIVRDLARAFGAPPTPALDRELTRREHELTRALHDALEPGLP
jgi:hypothetical protein